VFAALSAAAILIGSWAPFRLHSAEAGAVWQSFFRQGLTGDFSRSDVVVNFWLGFPLVLGLSGLVRAHHGNILRRIVWILLILVIQACLSLVAEIGQGWFAPRVASVADFGLQLMGGVVATLLWQLRGRWVESKFEIIFARQGNDLISTRLDAALTLTVLGILAWTLMPFDVIVSPMELARESLKTEIVPFTRFEGSLWENVYQWLASFLLAVPLGLWLCRRLATWYSGKLSFIQVMLLAIATGVLPEVCQFPIDSRVASATDALFGALGALSGILIGSQIQSTRFRLAKTSLREMVFLPEFWFALAMLQAMVICAVAWMPFDFSSEPSTIAERFEVYVSFPFSGNRGSDLLNLLTLFRQAMLAILLGGFLGVAHGFLRLKYPYSVLNGIAILLLLFVFSAFVEFGQIVTDSRTGDTLGILIRAAGSAFGLIVTMAFFRQS